MQPGLIKGYSIDGSGGVGRFVVVVNGAEDGGCKIPAGANAARFLGVTVESQATQNGVVPVCKTGVVRVTAGGTIAAGDRLAINSNAGDVKSVEAQVTAGPGSAAVVNIIGLAEVSAVAGDVFDMFIAPQTATIAAS